MTIISCKNTVPFPEITGNKSLFVPLIARKRNAFYLRLIRINEKGIRKDFLFFFFFFLEKTAPVLFKVEN